MKNQGPATSLYIHIPFCQRKCFFCSFVISVGNERHIDDYLQCLQKEARRHLAPAVKTLYIGGGTPSYLSNAQLARLITIIRDNFLFTKSAEFAIEANPESMDLAKAKLLKQLGINRVSLGIQSFQDKYLRFLARPHTGRDALKAFKVLRLAGFDNINVDLMYSFPGQTQKEIKRDVLELTALKSEHVSLYSLTIEEKSKFHTQQLVLPDVHLQAEHYLLVKELLGRHGFIQYEISNFAKKGKESRHNLIYWQGGNYIGLGVGAHSHTRGVRFWNTDNLYDYMAKIKQGSSATTGEEKLSPLKQLSETVVFGLRMNKGVDLRSLEERFGVTLDDERQKTISELIEGGFLMSTRRLKVTDKGRLVLDEICARLV